MPRPLHSTARGAVLAGALGSLASTLRAGRNAPRLLLIAIAIWVLRSVRRRLPRRRCLEALVRSVPVGAPRDDGAARRVVAGRLRRRTRPAPLSARLHVRSRPAGIIAADGMCVRSGYSRHASAAAERINFAARGRSHGDHDKPENVRQANRAVSGRGAGQPVAQGRVSRHRQRNRHDIGRPRPRCGGRRHQRLQRHSVRRVDGGEESLHAAR